MDNHKIWVSDLQDMLSNHIYTGLKKTFQEIKEMTRGHRLAIATQVAMEGIPTVGDIRIQQDYNIFVNSLKGINKTEQEYDSVLRSAYQSYALSALRGAGLQCDELNMNFIDGPMGKEFVHNIYINAAREIWRNPLLLINDDSVQLNRIIREAIEKSVRDGVNLNKLITAFNTGTIPSVYKAPARGKTIKQKFNERNHNRGLLDDDETYAHTPKNTTNTEDIIKMAGKIISKGFPPKPDYDDEVTVDDENFAPDNLTISTMTTTVNTEDLKSTKSIKSTHSTKSTQTAKHNVEVPSGLVSNATDNGSNTTVLDADDSMVIPVVVNNKERHLINNGRIVNNRHAMERDEDQESEYSVSTVFNPTGYEQEEQDEQEELEESEPVDDMVSVMTVKTNNTGHSRKSLLSRRRHIPKPSINNQLSFDDLPGETVEEISTVDEQASAVESLNSNIELLSYNDMLSRRLEILGSRLG